MRILKFVHRVIFVLEKYSKKVLNIMQPYFIGFVLKCIMNV